MPLEPVLDYYAVLEVGRTATHQEITSSYRRLALAHHPDRNQEDLAAATTRFQKIQEAYENLKDPSKRATYDRDGIGAALHSPFKMGGFSGFKPENEEDSSKNRKEVPYSREAQYQRFPGFGFSGVLPRGGRVGGPGGQGMTYEDMTRMFTQHEARDRQRHAQYRQIFAERYAYREQQIREWAEEQRRQEERRARKARRKAEAEAKVSIIIEQKEIIEEQEEIIVKGH